MRDEDSVLRQRQPVVVVMESPPKIIKAYKLELHCPAKTTFLPLSDIAQ